MTLTERRKRRIRERRENIFKNKKGISREERQRKKGSLNYNEKLREKYTELYFLIIKSFLDYGITNKIIEDY
jgi:hypothetical protein